MLYYCDETMSLPDLSPASPDPFFDPGPCPLALALSPAPPAVWGRRAAEGSRARPSVGCSDVVVTPMLFATITCHVIIVRCWLVGCWLVGLFVRR